MRFMLLASLATASALSCVDAQAEVGRNCVTKLQATLEAQPDSGPSRPTSSAQKPCPVAVAFTRRAAPGLRVDARVASIAPAPLASPGFRA